MVLTNQTIQLPKVIHLITHPLLAMQLIRILNTAFIFDRCLYDSVHRANLWCFPVNLSKQPLTNNWILYQCFAHPTSSTIVMHALSLFAFEIYSLLLTTALCLLHSHILTPTTYSAISSPSHAFSCFSPVVSNWVLEISQARFQNARTFSRFIEMAV